MASSRLILPDAGFTATIANGQTKSGAVDLGGRTLQGIFTPGALTGTALTFEAAPTADGTYVPVRKEDGSAYTLTVAASRYTRVDATLFAGLRFIKVVSGSSEGAERVLNLSSR